jgi:hypothetical protein
LWQGAAPSGSVANVVRDFVDAGGVVVQFPAGKGEEGKYRVGQWRTTDGLLANSKEGHQLPVNELTIARREIPVATGGTVLATFDDAKPFVVRQPSGKGATYRVATLPEREWSSLGEGTVLVPMIQRALLEGGRRLSKAGNADVGVKVATTTCLSDPTRAGQTLVAAGVYQIDGRIVALNRPAGEDEPEIVDEATVRNLFGSLPMRMLEDKGGGASSALQSEIWRWFLVAVLLFLTAEAFLALPEQAPVRAPDFGMAGKPTDKPALRPRETTEARR